MEDLELPCGQERVLQDLVSEADHWADQAGTAIIEANHVQQAIDEREFRASRIRDRSREQIARGIVMIATEGRRLRAGVSWCLSTGHG